MKKPEAVVFDMDGVIFDSETCVIESWKVVAGKYNIKDIESACKACLGLNRDATKRVMLERYGKDFPYDKYKDEASAIYHKKYSGGRLPMKPGVVELLKYLKENNIRVALASSTRSGVVNPQLIDAGIMKYFHKVICGDMVTKSKPDPEIFLKACEELLIRPENAIAIEDSFNGIRSAHAAGMKVVMVPDLVQPDEEIRGKADYVLGSLYDVIELLRIKFCDA